MSKYTTNGKKSLRKTMGRFIFSLASHVLRARETLALRLKDFLFFSLR